MKNSNPVIDIVIPWLDGSDPQWIAEKEAFLQMNGRTELSVDASDSRYRDSGTLKYALRGIDRYMPWVHTVHLVTWGHLPVWLNKDADGLNIVNHKDFIPSKYLPTFSSHTIELNFHRIPDLSEQFIYFNDDMIPLRPLTEDMFFQNGLPVDFAVETELYGRFSHSIAGVLLSNAAVINEHFSKHQVIKKSAKKWFSVLYGTNILKTLMHLPYPCFSDFSNNHTCNPFLKETFVHVWKQAYDILDETCSHRFRVMSDVNQWLMRDWQLVTGKFVPKPCNVDKTLNVTNDLTSIAEVLRQKKYRTVCINDVAYEKLDDVEKTMAQLTALLEESFPNESRFEINSYGKP